MSLLARVGRDRQRYEDNLRLVSGCIPYRIVEDDNDQPEKRVEVLMVTSPNRNDLVFPKVMRTGGWEDDESVEEAACREAFEEAGVKGILSEKSIGMWEFRSKSSQEEDCSSPVGGCRGHMFTLEVTEELHAWPEQDNHSRRWVNVKEAFELCRYEWMRQALMKFAASLDAELRDEALDELLKSSSDAVPSHRTIPSPSCSADPNGNQSHCAVPVAWLVVPAERETFA
ncbi:hypothetical protein MLD38_024423 [Melastoma candidum]|uniref:Uncharacterized protein n=1 Tax=Melastoma candidum TaxID=119954 RepID=A0ACB9NXA3_9MYRT|nr:hypothetical protein MLD38_024423 [Melastoma candidum]